MNLLQAGIQAHQAGHLQQALQYYSQHLEKKPSDPDARQLIGLVYSSLGDFERAISNMQRSLSINSRQPHVLNNLGACQIQLGHYDDAVLNFRKAIEQREDFLDPYKNLIPLLMDLKRYDEARTLLDGALRSFQNDKIIAKLNAKYFRLVENYAKSIELYEALFAASPDTVSIKHDLALTLRLAGQPARALILYDELESSGLAQFQFYHNKANALSDLGQQRSAIDYYRKAIALNPAYVESHINLNELLWELGDNRSFLTSYKEAFELTSGDLDLRFAYAATLLRISEFELVLTFLDRLPDTFKQDHRYYDLYAQALSKLDRKNEALAVLQHLMAFNDVSVQALLNGTETMLESGDAQGAINVINRALKQESQNKHAWALLGVAWRLTNDPRHLVLNDYDNLVREYTIDVPEGFDSVEHFCRELNDYLSSLHTANRQPLEQTLMGGTQTRGNLFNDPNPLIQALVSQFKICIDNYIKSTKQWTGRLPVLQHTDHFRFSGSWSVRLQSAGFHTPHVHPMGWLSSAFYVQLPTVVANDDEKAGWFALGQPKLDLPTTMKPERYVKPVVGKLVLFQSYMWHGTVPFEAKETRTTVAFDVAHHIEG